jgi:hypothetical protein
VFKLPAWIDEAPRVRVRTIAKRQMDDLVELAVLNERLSGAHEPWEARNRLEMIRTRRKNWEHIFNYVTKQEAAATLEIIEAANEQVSPFLAKSQINGAVRCLHYIAGLPAVIVCYWCKDTLPCSVLCRAAVVQWRMRQQQRAAAPPPPGTVSQSPADFALLLLKSFISCVVWFQVQHPAPMTCQCHCIRMQRCFLQRLHQSVPSMTVQLHTACFVSNCQCC